MDRRKFIIIGGVTLAIPLLNISKAFGKTPEEEAKLRSLAGEFSVTPDQLVVGDKPAFIFTYTAGDRGIKKNGFLKLVIPGVWTEPQNRNPNLEGYVTSVLKEIGTLTIEPGKPDNTIIITMTQDLPPQEKLTIIYGDKSHGGGGVKITDFPWQDFTFPLLLDSDGTGAQAGKLLSNTITIKAGNAVKARTFAPGTARIEETILVKACLGDDYFNYPDPSVSYKATIPNQPNVKAIPVESGDRILSAKPTGPGILTVTTLIDKLSSQSNPITILDKKEPWDLFFGDIHGHSLGSDGLEPPEHYFAYGREMAGLDVCILTDHAECIYPPNKYNWEYLVKTAEDAHRPGEFVTFPAFEWTSGTWGHRCVYYQNANDAIKARYFNSTYKESDTPEKLYQLVRDFKPLLIPHHTLALYKWEVHDPELEPLVEVYSMWGSSEYANNPLWSLNMKTGESVGQGLNLGYILGFVGAGDNHHGQPAQCITLSKFPQLRYHNGITGFWAEKLTREKIWEALLARRTYATTGARIFVRFSINDQPMGSQIKNGNELLCKWEILGTNKLKEISIISNWNKIITSVTKINSEGHEGSYKIELPEKPNANPSFYYLRIEQTDNNWAWTSPIWVNKA